jgi:signal transduction histidine kinase
VTAASHGEGGEIGFIVDALHQHRVLLVDDDRGLLRLIQRSLQREGFSTALANSGQAAQAWLEQNRADLMLLDLKLQDIQGQDLVARLAQSSRCPPFIIITGQGDERVAVEMMKRGALDYLVKDVDFLQFVPSVVKRALEQLRKEQRLAEAEEQVRRDITERKRLEREILEISDQERRRIGQDLHDGLCQQLAGIELMSEVLHQKLRAKSKSNAARAGDIARHVREAISHTRSLARGLAPVTLESEGLPSALRELATNTEKIFGVACRIECVETVPVLATTAATHLYRIAQEAVSNAIKHGKATQLVIRLRRAEERLDLDVVDNGTGMTKAPPRNDGMGLRIMRYRAGMINGLLSIEPGEGGGTRVSCSVPMRLPPAPPPPET